MLIPVEIERAVYVIKGGDFAGIVENFDAGTRLAAALAENAGSVSRQRNNFRQYVGTNRFKPTDR